MTDNDNYLPVEYSTDFWDKFCQDTRDEDWEETIDRLNTEGFNIRMQFEDDEYTHWPQGLIFGSPAEKLKFLLKFS